MISPSQWQLSVIRNYPTQEEMVGARYQVIPLNFFSKTSILLSELFVQISFTTVVQSSFQPFCIAIQNQHFSYHNLYFQSEARENASASVFPYNSQFFVLPSLH